MRTGTPPGKGLGGVPQTECGETLPSTGWHVPTSLLPEDNAGHGDDPIQKLARRRGSPEVECFSALIIS